MIRRFPHGVSGGAARPAAEAGRGRPVRAAAVLLCLFLAAALSGPFGAARPASAAETGSPDAAARAADPKPATAPGDASAAPAAKEERRELWTGSLYTSTYRIGLCVKPSGEARGVVLLRIYNGDVDVYHVEGTVRNGRITARHHSGHTFEGKYDSSDRASGTITLKSGRRISLKAKRTPDARLTEDDCRPLPE